MNWVEYPYSITSVTQQLNASLATLYRDSTLG